MCPWVCPDENCPQRNSLQKGEKCPTCGVEAAELGFFDLKILLDEKIRLHEANVPPKGEDFFGREENPQGRIPSPKVGTDTSQLDQKTISLLKTVVKQNKTIIKQNKQIYSLVEDARKKSSRRRSATR